MEILVSLVIGIVLMELYVWLDPFTRRLVGWAAKQLPADREAEFQAQWEGDLAAVPNSLFKLYFVLRDCVLPIKDIQQTMFREEFAEIADGVDEFVAHFKSRLVPLMTRSAAILDKSELAGSALISDMDRILERLQQQHGEDTLSAINTCRALKPDLVEKFSNYHTCVQYNHSVLLEVASPLCDKLEGLVGAQLHIRTRLLDARPLQDADGNLLDSLLAAYDQVNEALDGFGKAPSRYLNAPADLLPAVKATCEAFKTAIRAAKRH
jgi:hypothetical protein